jgi:hypothetical protein
VSIYDVLKRIIGRGGYDMAIIQSKMNLLFVYDQLTQEQYDDLAASMA